MTEAKEKIKRPLQETYYYPVIFMVLVTFVFIAVLAYLNDSTSEIIKKASESKERESILYVLGIENDASFDGILAAYEDQVIEEDYGYVSKESGDIAFFFSGSGLWGEIDGFLAVSDDMKTLKGLVFTEQSETPGLGGRIDELWFREQFRGVKLDSTEGDLIKYKPEPGGDVDAISGATSTSKAVLNILNPFLKEKIDELKGGE